ncbi:MAG TPA: XdhC family protein, partial [Thermoanaerobaculia bacterium]
EAQRALLDGKPRLLALTPDPTAAEWTRPGVAVFPMTCHSGGSVEIYLEPILPAPRLVVFGASPTARALVRLAKAMGYSVTAVGAAAASETAAAGPSLFPQADEVLADPAPLAARPHASLFAVVATMGEGDEEAIRGALSLSPAYLGVVASAKRFAQMRGLLLGQGVSAEALAGIRSPAGIAIGAQMPEEIALSVLAEIVERRRAAPSGVVGSAAPGAAEGEGAAEAVDPICGMTVEIATVRHTAEHAGRTYYFCGSGCRERFLAAPARFAVARAAGGGP